MCFGWTRRQPHYGRVHEPRQLASGSHRSSAGVWTPHLARQIGVFVPLEGAKGYHVDWQRTSGDPHFPVFITEARVIATPLPEVLRFGGTLELDGLNPRINPTRVEAIKRAAYETFSHTRNAAITEIWSGLRPCTPDGLPMIGWAPGFDNLIIATGHGMSGLQLSDCDRTVGERTGLPRAAEPRSAACQARPFHTVLRTFLNVALDSAAHDLDAGVSELVGHGVVQDMDHVADRCCRVLDQLSCCLAEAARIDGEISIVGQRLCGNDVYPQKRR